ncbi:MAG: GAF domain-containing protein, partial [Candidatus Limnocylindrales bacterium]
MTATLSPRPLDANLSVTKAARMLGVHPNTVRAWSDAGRLRYFRINPRGDRRYRLGDLQRFLASAEHVAVDHASAQGRRLAGGIGADSGRSRPDADQALPGSLVVAAAPPAVRHRRDLALLDLIARIALGSTDLEGDLGRVVQAIRRSTGHALVAVWALRGERLSPVAVAAADGLAVPRLMELPRNFGVLGRALESAPSRVITQRDVDETAVALIADSRERVTVTILPGERAEVAAAIPGRDGALGVLLIVSHAADGLDSADQDLVAVLADAIGPIAAGARREAEIAHLLHRAEALRRVTSDIGSRLDLDRILAGLVDHAMVLFEGDRAAVFLRHPDGKDVAEVSRGLSAEYQSAMRPVYVRSLAAAAITARRPLFAVDYRNDPRGIDVRAAVVQEGYDTICCAPLMDGAELLGFLNVYHDRPHEWSDDELETIAALATQASVAIRTAQNFQQMATWTAQLQSIQQLGARLSHLSRVHDIGMAIATELRQIIDYHNVRVYRVEGRDLIPVAMRGQV